MKPRFLLPNRLKTVGWILLFPSLLFGVSVFHFDFVIEGFEIMAGSSLFKEGQSVNNLTDELALTTVLISSFFIAFSVEKVEDERVGQIRLESLQLCVYFNYAFLLVTTWLVYDEGFFMVMVYNMFTILFLFILRFNLVLYVFPALNGKGHEK